MGGHHGSHGNTTQLRRFKAERPLATAHCPGPLYSTGTVSEWSLPDEDSRGEGRTLSRSELDEDGEGRGQLLATAHCPGPLYSTGTVSERALPDEDSRGEGPTLSKSELDEEGEGRGRPLGCGGLGKG